VADRQDRLAFDSAITVRRHGLRALAAFAVFGMLGAAPPARAQNQTPPPAGAPTAPAQADPLTFTAPRMLVVFQIVEANGVDFEVTMGKVKEVLAKSDKPERRQQAAHWKVFKSDAPQNGVATYFFLLDQVVPGVSYDPFKILPEGLPPEEVKALFDKLGPGLKGISAAPLGPIISMAMGGGGGGA
jgi:hypothetical protein